MGMVNLLQIGQGYKRYNWLLILIAPLLLYLIPNNAVFNGTSVCIFKNVFGFECYGCGMTRAIFSLMYLDFSGAYNYNHLVVIVAPILIYIWIKSISVRLNNRK